jgi:Ca2+-binding RTX toxin-like protein
MRDDHLIGNSGVDILHGGTGDDTLEGVGGQDQLFGEAGVDKLFGGNDDDTLQGGAGDDTLDGGADSDTLDGGADNDTLFGGTGKDSLTGGGGIDTFDFDATNESGTTVATADTIIGFVHLTDKIDLSTIDAKTQGGFAGDQAFVFINNATPAVNPGIVANSITWFEQGGNTIVQLDNSGNTTIDMMIVLNGTGLGLTAADFHL